MTRPSAPATASEGTPAASIDQRIDDSYGDLAPQEQRAADFILDHLDDLAVYNASELARLSGVSKATVSRLFRSLGFSDAQEVRAHARALRGQGVPLGGIALESGSPAVVDAHFEHEQANLRGVRQLVNDGRLSRAADLIALARRVVVIGLRNSYPVALHLREQLVQGLDDVRLAPQPGQSIGEELAGLTPADVVVVVGFRRRPDGFGRILDAARQLAVPVVLLSDASARRHADFSEVWLECSVDSVVALDSYAAAHSLVALLASESLGVATRGSRTRIASINRLFGDLSELEPTT